MPIDIVLTKKKHPIPSGKIKQMIRSIAKAESKKELGSITLVFLNNAAMRRLNIKFLGHDYPTDVISFDLSTRERIEGEVYIGIDKAVVQAKDYDVPFSNEILRLAAHGFLHILGYDDNTKKKRAAMLKRGDRYISKLK